MDRPATFFNSQSLGCPARGQQTKEDKKSTYASYLALDIDSFLIPSVMLNREHSHITSDF